jgi:hypothetical protein
MEKLKFYKSFSKYYFEIEDSFYSGKIILGKGNHGGEAYHYVDYLEWDDEVHPNSEEIKNYIETNLYLILNNVETL